MKLKADPDKQTSVIAVAIHGKFPIIVSEYRRDNGVTKMVTDKLTFRIGAIKSCHFTTKIPFSGDP